MRDVKLHVVTDEKWGVGAKEKVGDVERGSGNIDERTAVEG